MDFEGEETFVLETLEFPAQEDRDTEEDGSTACGCFVIFVFLEDSLELLE